MHSLTIVDLLWIKGLLKVVLTWSMMLGLLMDISKCLISETSLPRGYYWLLDS